MKTFALALFAAICALPLTASAQRVLPIGNIAKVDSTAPTTWGMSGWEMIHVTKSDGSFTPIMRTETWDARTVEILSRTQAPPLRASDIHTESVNGHEYILVRNYLLLEVKPQDARAEGTTKEALADKWISKVRYVLPKVAPLPSRTGV